MDFAQYVFAQPYFGWLCRGVLNTLVISLISGLWAAVIGFLVLQCHISSSRALRYLGIAYVMVFRNLPLVPLLLFLEFGLPGLWTAICKCPFPRGLEFELVLLGLSLNTGAYLAEILRAGVEAVAPQHFDTARTLGLTPRNIYWQVVYPQAVCIMAPALASRFIHNMKNSTLSLIMPLPVEMMEVVGQAGRIAGQTFSWAGPVVFAACVHLSLAFGLGQLLNRPATLAQARILAAAPAGAA